MRVVGPLLNPVSEIVGQTGGLASRASELAGKKVALLDNIKPGAEDILKHLGERLTEKHGIASYIYRAKPSSADSVPEEIDDEIRKTCDCVITGVGN